MRFVHVLELGAVMLAVACGGAERVTQRRADGSAQPDAITGTGLGGAGGAGGVGVGGAGVGGAAGSLVGGTSGSGSGGAGVGGGGAGGGGTGGGGAGGSGGSAPDAGAGGAGGTPCTAGHALQFDGANDYLTAMRQIQDDFTIEAWIKTSATSLTGTRFWEGNGLVYADLKGVANDFGTSVLNNKVVFGVGDQPVVQSTSNVNSGSWVHVAFTRVRATGAIAVLVNGVVEATAIPAQTASLIDQPVITIGGNTIDNRYFNGVMDEVRLWTIARSAAEIQATMHRVLTGSETGLVGYWRFDETSGSTAADSSPSRNTASGNAAAVDAATPSAPAHVVSDAPLCP